jgi:ferric-dicitrate binding protein FerR (iron transport regulator)
VSRLDELRRRSEFRRRSELWRRTAPGATERPVKGGAPNGSGMEGRVPAVEQVASVYRQLADAYSNERSKATHERAWQRIELKGSLRKKGRALVPRARVRWAAYSLAALAVVAVLALLVWPEEGRIKYALHGGRLHDGWIVPVEQLATLSFTDGSLLELSEGSALSVDALGPHSALSRLARGRVHVRVQHHDDTKWTFLAGPYEVRVEGTAFDLS